MGPKKKEEEIDLQTLPPWQSLNCMIKFQGKKERMQILINNLLTQPKSFQRNITREEIIEFAKEKGLYTDPNTLNEKQKKDTKFLESTNLELTPKVLAEAFNALKYDLDIKGRKIKKLNIDALNEANEDKKVDQKKKGDKKETKKGKHQEEIKEEKKPLAELEKEYKKNIDVFYLLFDYPQTKEEIHALSYTNNIINLIFDTKEKVIWPQIELQFQQQQPEQAGIVQKDEEQEEEDPDIIESRRQEQEMIEKLQKEQLNEKDYEYIYEVQEYINLYKQARKEVGKEQILRNSVIKEIIYQNDILQKDESFKSFLDYFLEEICMFSFDIQQFQEWIKGKKELPLCPLEYAKKQREEEEKRKVQERLMYEQQILEEQKEKEKKQGKKEAKKDDKKGKKDDQKLEEERKQQELLLMQKQQELLEKNQDLPPALEVEPFQFYYMQLENVNLQKTGPGILLECLLDQIQQEKNQELNNKNNQKDNVQNILNTLSNKIDYKSNKDNINNNNDNINNKNNNIEFLEQQIIDENDEIEKKSQNQTLNKKDEIQIREKNLLKNLVFPGLDRQNMPEIPEKSIDLRNAEKALIYPFISCDVSEFERRQTICKFEEILNEAEPEREWNFGDRIYIERFNKNTLCQSLQKALLQEPLMVTKYNSREDNLFIVLYFKNPPGRVFRKKWNAEWQVMPNLENWIQFFKNNEVNYKNEVYYNIDYEVIGNLHERIKYMFPGDNSVIYGNKFQVGDKIFYRYKIIKENVVFGIRENRMQQCNFWAQFENSNQLYNNQEYVPQINISLSNGLIVKFLSNGDVYQQIMDDKNKLLYKDYDDINPNDNSKQSDKREIKRIVTGKGTGLRKARNIINNSEQQYESVPCAKRTDPNTGSQIIIREDQTLIIKYIDGSVYTKHFDGTQIYTAQDKNTIIIEHNDFATIKVLFDINNEKILETYLPDKTKVIFIKDYHQIFLDDGSQQIERPQTPDFQDGEYIDEEYKNIYPQTEKWNIRLFVVQNDNTGYELLNQFQVQNYFNQKQENESCQKVIEDSIKNKNNCTSYTFISSLLQLEDKKIYHLDPQYPQDLDIISKKQTQKVQKNSPNVFTFRNLLKFENFDSIKREEHKKDIEKFYQWKKEYQKQSNEFGIIQKSEVERQEDISISLQILNFRKNCILDENYEEAKDNFIKNLKKKQEKDSQKKKMEKEAENLDEIQKTQNEKNSNIQKISKKQKNIENNFQNEFSLKIQKKKDVFVTHFFETEEGLQALNSMEKYIFLPVVLAPNLKDVNRNDIEDLNSRANEYQQSFKNTTLKATQFKENDQPIVQLEPEGNQQGYMSQKQPFNIIIKPSVFTQREIDEEKRLIEDEREALRYRKIKTKDYNILGDERKEEQKQKIPCLFKSNPISELNQKYLLTDSLTEKRIKISSLANRLYLKAPSINEQRNTGSHQALAKTLDKKYNIDDLENRKNLMLTADLNDQLKKDISIIPCQVNFGVLKNDRIYQTKIVIKNEDILAQRVVLKQPQSQYIKVFLNELGTIPMGLTRDIIVRINASAEIIGKFTEEFQVMTKHSVYRIPIQANILESREFDYLVKESKEIHGKHILKQHVKELEIVTFFFYFAILFLKDKRKDVNESQQSELFPKLNNFDKNYQIDPTKNIIKNKKENNNNDSFEQSFND
ncbi:hypothetical protein IMG5_126590 [Ichthyophthirius multifiliis]|uniref:Uncharacterized protein n=1 Tax=Ichthyophthirius multifiliis TaxID=5932 RepID=G0QVU6_ICHMU|nr:hypothetical protein IMG5_126590 [Ichthyophthirius multifiliis]EGR30654.1 hypothetical protein IMG5_126590 [Ichthyophthirius multifiliis]|eukprot:XP_004032241.1 hypothetical protein IMG5_126590 [Ichthyophthirius multifiliis]